MNLNLARKWRSKNFDQVIGQTMPVRLLKNSLYLNHFFPVYLFAGQHGCGKTSTARIFAAAANCTGLENFRLKPHEHTVPCGTCPSCSAMAKGCHPDFFEIDAASHTGVDTMRQIIEAASLLPLLGERKIYLIDEAHMLSKAAFNALLKILEEPPASVVFMLATTDEQKIIETVQSRCFKLFFSPVKSSVLVEYLAQVCSQEQINYHLQALELIAEESKGSVRDALNLLEQVRFARGSVTPEVVMRILGRIDNASLVQIIQLVTAGDPHKLLQALQACGWYTYKAELLWQRLLVIIRAVLWHSYGATLEQSCLDKATLDLLVQQCSTPFLHKAMQLLYTHEQLFMKTTAQHALLDALLLQLCHKKNTRNGGSGTASSGISGTPQIQATRSTPENPQEQELDEETQENASASLHAQQWAQCIRHIEQRGESLLISVMQQAQFVSFESKTAQVHLALSQSGSFFADIIHDAQHLWEPVLQDVFGTGATLVISQPTPQPAQRVVVHEKPIEHVVTHPVRPAPHTTTPRIQQLAQTYQSKTVTKRQKTVGTHGPLFTPQDTENWPLTHMLLKHFPGQIHEQYER